MAAISTGKIGRLTVRTLLVVAGCAAAANQSRLASARVVSGVARLAAGLISLGLVSGCMSVEGTNARAENLKQRCVADGHGPSTPDYFTCINAKTQNDMMLDMLIPGYALFH